MGGFTGLVQVICIFFPALPIGAPVLLLNLPLPVRRRIPVSHFAGNGPDRIRRKAIRRSLYGISPPQGAGEVPDRSFGTCQTVSV